MTTGSPSEPEIGQPQGSTADFVPELPFGTDVPEIPLAQVDLSPLYPNDPPQIGPYWLDARLTSCQAGIAYVGHDDENTPAMLVLLSAGATGDAAARDRFAGLINEMDFDTVLLRGGHGQHEGRLAKKFFDESHEPTEPGSAPEASWAALAYDGSPAALSEADRVLAEVQLANKPQLGRPTGPDYQLPWIEEDQPGLSRVWPLPWPGRHDRAGWLSILASWLLMLLIAAMAVLIAILIFQQASNEAPPPPVPTSSSSSDPSSSDPSSSGSPSSGSPSSGSPTSDSPSSGSPTSGSPTSGSPTSGSPTPSNSQTESQSASPTNGSEQPGGGGTTPTSKLVLI